MFWTHKCLQIRIIYELGRHDNYWGKKTFRASILDNSRHTVHVFEKGLGERRKCNVTFLLLYLYQLYDGNDDTR